MDERSSYCFQPKTLATDNQGHSSAHVPHSAGIGLSQPLHFGRYMGEEQGRLQHQHLQSDQHGLSSHPHPPHAHPHSHPHLSDRYMGEERGRLQHQHLQNDQQGLSSHPHPPHPHPHPHQRPHLSDRYMGEERGRLQHQHLQSDQHGLSSHPHPPHPHPFPRPHLSSSAQPHELREAIYVEIEKEKIRREIIMSEILRRRAVEFEAQARRKMRIEREFSLGTKAFTLGSQSSMENCYYH